MTKTKIPDPSGIFVLEWSAGYFYITLAQAIVICKEGTLLRNAAGKPVRNFLSLFFFLSSFF